MTPTRIMIAGTLVPANPKDVVEHIHSLAPWAQEAILYLADVARNTTDQAIVSAVVANQEWLRLDHVPRSDEEASVRVQACADLHLCYRKMYDEDAPMRARVNAAIHISRCLRPFITIQDIGPAVSA